MCRNEYDAHKALKGHRVVCSLSLDYVRSQAKLSVWQRLIRWLNTP